jgi:hypothetical protein
MLFKSGFVDLHLGHFHDQSSEANVKTPISSTKRALETNVLFCHWIVIVEDDNEIISGSK